MSDDIVKLNTTENARPAPKKIVRPCEWGLRLTIKKLEEQLGSIEAYNMLVDYSSDLRVKIDSGKAQPQNKYFSTKIGNVE